MLVKSTAVETSGERIARCEPLQFVVLSQKFCLSGFQIRHGSLQSSVGLCQSIAHALEFRRALLDQSAQFI